MYKPHHHIIRVRNTVYLNGIHLSSNHNVTIHTVQFGFIICFCIFFSLCFFSWCCVVVVAAAVTRFFKSTSAVIHTLTQTQLMRASTFECRFYFSVKRFISGNDSLLTTLSSIWVRTSEYRIRCESISPVVKVMSMGNLRKS